MVNMSTSLYCQHCQHFGVFSTFARKIFPFPQGSQLTFMRKWRFFVIHGAPSWPSWAPRRSAWSPVDNEKSSLPHDFPKTWGSEVFFCYPRVAQLTFLRKMKIFRCPRGPKWPYWGSEDFSIPTGTHECTFCLRKIIIKRPFWPRISTVCGEILAQSRSPRSLLFMEKKCVLSSGGP